ncbi:CGNR zinc finger domain-containing protein [Variovorax sp. DAIF25]|uniref:CGNR zinc finger domain-containing protein n=1 Tax=Variovorax sp. DAIF25 TaxID=3080983 RepID=UPI003D6A2709
MSEVRPPPMFLADSPALDFLNSVAVPTDTQVEWLGSGEDLLNWLREAGMVDPQVLRELGEAAGPGQLDAVAAQARALREWFRAFVRQHQGARLTRKSFKELEALNRLLARDEAFEQIEIRDKASTSGDEPSELVWVRRRRWRSADSLLLPIAQSMAELLATADFTHVKACEGPACTLMFLDTTRGRIRRWCSMAVCGNRAKQAAHRSKLSSEKH